MEAKRLHALIEERKDELFSLLSSLVKINSESFGTYGNEAEMAEHVLSLTKELGLESEIYSPLDLPGFTEHPDYLEGRSLENRPNVTARWRGAEDADELLLMAHTDTVRIGAPELWDGDPLSGRIEDGRIYGRGACDDKYAIATVLFLIKLLKEEGFAPKKNLVFAAYCDEEYGGSHGALAAVLRTPCPRIISMDGRDKQIWNCASGGGEFFYRYHLKAPADSAKNAALAIPTALAVMDEFAKKRHDELEANPYYTGTHIPPTSLRYMGVHAGNLGVNLNTGELHFVYYTDKTRPEIMKEFKELEGVFAERLAPFGFVSGEFTPATRFFHYASTAPDSEDILALVEAGREAGDEIAVCGSCLSDLSVINKYGSSNAFAYGAGRDFSLPGGAHQTNEYIECDRLVKYTQTIGGYILKVLG